MLEFVQKISQTSGNFTNSLNPDDVLGHSVATIGDLNGDGIIDLAVGSPRSDDGGWENGAIYILFLNRNGTIKSQQKISEVSGNFAINLDRGDIFGASMTGIGDCNGDGIPDLAVSAYLADDGGIDRGAFYLFYMNTNGAIKSYKKISQTYGDFTEALDDEDAFGRSLANIGDFDGNGVTDLAVGARGDDDGGTDRGAIYILCMNSNGTVETQQKVSSTVGNFTGLRNGDLFGTATASLGDLDGDGITDLAVGSPLDDDGGENRGALYILFMNSNGTVKSQQKISALAGDFTASLDNNDYFGWSISNLGDFNRDGIVDIAVGALNDDDGGTDRGAVYFLYLNTDGTVQSYQKISDTQGGFSGKLDNEDHFGTAITLLGDLNGNDIPEVAVGAFYDDDGGTDKGAVYVLFPVAPNGVPIAVDDAVATDEETLLTGNVLVDNGYGSDSDPNHNILTIVAVNESNVNVGHTITLASGALVTLKANGNFSYDPNGNFDRVTPGYSIPVTDSFNYTISDGHGKTSNGTVIVTINGVNDAPTLAISSLQVNENSHYHTFVGTPTATDPDRHDTLTYSIIDGNANHIFGIDRRSGSIYVFKGLSLNYEVQDRYSLTVKIQDAGGLSDTATIPIYLNDVNDVPVVNDQSLNIAENSANGTIVGTVKASDEDAGQQLTYSLIQGNESNLFAINHTTGAIFVKNGSLLNYEGNDRHTLTVQVTDNGIGNLLDTATITINLQDANDAPIVTHSVFNIFDGNSPLTNAFEVSDEDRGDYHTFKILSQTDYGKLSNNSNGTFTFDVEDDFQDLSVGEIRTVNSNYQAIDSRVAASNMGTITFNVTGINDRPVVQEMNFSVGEDASYFGNFAGDDIDRDDNPHSLTYTVTDPNPESSMVIGNNGTFSFNSGNAFSDLAEGETGQMSLSYQATDSHLSTSHTGLILITVVGANDNPIATNMSLTVAEDEEALLGGFAGDDVDSDDSQSSLTYTILSNPNYGTISNNNDGTFTFNLGNDFSDLNAGQTRTVSFTYQATDSHWGVSNTASATIAVIGVNNTYTGTDSSEILVGTDSRDTISGQNGNDVIYGYRGNGVSGVGNNAVAPTVDNSPINDGDILKGASGNDTLYGGNGNDDLYGGLGNDYLWGGNGNDTLRGESSNDRLLGGEGNDLYLWSSGYGRDFYQDIEGLDTLQVQNGDLTLSNSFDTISNGIDKIVGLGSTNILGNNDTDNWNFQNTILMSIGTINGQNGNDSIQGSQGNDKLLGGNGHDTLKGNDGVDTINGNAGNDFLTGGLGNDILTGGDGYDRSIFNTPNEGVDTITDFNTSRDSLGISASGFGGGLTAGTLTTTQFVLGSVATNPHHRFIYNSSNGNLFFDSDGNTLGGDAQVLIAKFSNLPSLSSKNIVVI